MRAKCGWGRRTEVLGARMCTWDVVTVALYFLDNAIQKNGYKLASAGTGILANVGLYSLKHKAIAQVPQGGKVGIANDPVNQGRGLLLLQKVGLIKLKPGVGYLGSLDDIVENPKKLSFVEVEGPQLVRITGDVDIAQGYPHFIVAAKAFDPSSGLAYSGIEDARFSIQFVVKASRTQDPVVQKFIRIYQNSDAVKAEAQRAFSNDKAIALAIKRRTNPGFRERQQLRKAHLSVEAGRS